MLRYSFYTYGNFVLHYGSRNLDNLLVGKFLGVQPLGFYKKAYDLFALPTSQLLSPLANVALASLSRYSDETDKLKRYFFDAISIIAFVSMGISLVLTVSAADIILLLLGPAWGKTAEIFALFGPGIGFVLIYGTHGWLHLALGRAERWLRWGLFEFAVTAAFITVGIAFGLRAVALAWTCSYLILAGPSIWYAGRPIRLRFWAFYSCIWKYALAALGAGLLTRFSLASFGPVARAFSGLSVLLRIPVAFALSLAAYVAFVVLLHGNGRPISRFVGLTKEMIARRASPRA
jgi:PST family polysaccharide transporter